MARPMELLNDRLSAWWIEPAWDAKPLWEWEGKIQPKPLGRARVAGTHAYLLKADEDYRRELQILCARWFWSKEGRAAHIAEHHLNGAAVIAPMAERTISMDFACGVAGCDFESDTAASVKGHRARMHRSSEPTEGEISMAEKTILRCDAPGCEYETTHAPALANHRKYQHPIVDKKPATPSRPPTGRGRTSGQKSVQSNGQITITLTSSERDLLHDLLGAMPELDLDDPIDLHRYAARIELLAKVKEASA